MREITIFLLMREKSYSRNYLRSIDNQTFRKNKIHLFIDVSQLEVEGRTTVYQFIEQQRPNYAAIMVITETDRSRSASVDYAIRNDTHYFRVDENVILHPRALRRMHDLHLEVVSPMLVYDGLYSNFHAAVDENGYYRDSDVYFKILRRELKGIHDVPVVNACYLVNHRYLTAINYQDGSGRLEYVIFSDTLRRRSIPQYIDNTFNYGVLLNHSQTASSEKAALTLAINNADFYLNLTTTGKRGIICDADWLAGFVVTEHLYLIRLLNELHQFHIINCARLDFTNPAIIDDLNTYELLLIAYNVYTRVPLDEIKSYKIYRIDDMENDPHYTQIAKFNISNSDMIISPYGYVFDRYYHHGNVKWVPYSCAIEGLSGYEQVQFNTNPKPKVLQSGNLAATYPFRQYVASLDNSDIERLPHQGWRQSDNESAVINLKYYKRLNEYLCCFVDALTYRYIVLKNFEIAAVGALLLTDELIEKEMGQLGFIGYETCIFCNQENFLEKVSWILDPGNRQRVDTIRRAGMRLVWERHLARHRAAQIDDLASGAVR